MNLQEEMLNAIDNECGGSATDVSAATEAACVVAERNAIEFGQWIGESEYCQVDGQFWLDKYGKPVCMLTKQLYQLFLNSKDNGK